MKYYIRTIMISILLLTISACNNQTDIPPEKNSAVESLGSIPLASDSEDQKNIDSESEKIVDNSSSQDALDSSQESEITEEDPKPFSIDEFRNAIDEVVQESIQEDVEKAVKDEVAKQTGKQK